MASLLLRLDPLSKKVISEAFTSSLGSVRNASKKGATSKPKKASKSRPGRFGVKRYENAVVNPGVTIVHQRYLVACPGLNVGVGRIADLYAKVAGKVVLSYEKTNLDSNNYLVFTKYPDSLPTFKTYFNVIPDPQHQRFKLIETI